MVDTNCQQHSVKDLTDDELEDLIAEVF